MENKPNLMYFVWNLEMHCTFDAITVHREWWKGRTTKKEKEREKKIMTKKNKMS